MNDNWAWWRVLLMLYGPSDGAFYVLKEGMTGGDKESRTHCESGG